MSSPSPAASSCWRSRSISKPSAGPSLKSPCRRRRGSRPASTSWIDVKPASGFLAQVTRLDQVRQDLGRFEPFLAEALVQNDHDPVADVEADEIGERERAHRVVEANLRSRVDVLG